MTRRLLVLLVACAAPAFAVNRQMILVRYSMTTATPQLAVANRLYCARVPATASMTATKLVGMVEALGATTAGVAIYPDSDGGTELGEAVASVTNDGGAGTRIPATGLSMTFVEGTTYRVCICVDNVTLALPLESQHGGGVAIQWPYLNAGTTVVGHAANTCTTGNPPATTGALTADTSTPLPLVLVEE